MKHRKTSLMFALSLVALLMVSSVYLQPAGAETGDLPEPDENYIDELIEEIQGEEETGKPLPLCVWIVRTKGYAWKIEVEPTASDVAPSARVPMAMKLMATPVKITALGKLFRIRGAVTLDGKTFKVHGVAVLKRNGFFCMKLDGEGHLRLYAVGRVLGGHGLYYVRMKGRMGLDGRRFAFYQRGTARRLWVSPASAGTAQSQPQINTID